MAKYPSLVFFLACTLAISALPTVTRADTLSDATAIFYLGGPTTYSVDLSLAYPGLPVTENGAYGSAAAMGGSDPFVRVWGGGEPSPALRGVLYYTGVTEVYEFEINGPAGQTVPITVSGAGYTSVDLTSAGAGAEAYLSIAGVVSDSVCMGAPINLLPRCNIPGNTFTQSGDVDVQTNTVYTVNLSAGVLNANGIAFVDPTIALDTADPNYSLSFSPGVTPALVPTPEPNYAALTLPFGAALIFFRFARRPSFSAA